MRKYNHNAETTKPSKKRFWFGFLIFLGFLLVLFILEKSLHHKVRQRNTPYELSFYTHDGKTISLDTELNSATKEPKVIGLENPNSLKLTLAPYTIYKNLPNQRTKWFTINSLGFRGEKEMSTLKGRQKRIIVVGGSAAFGAKLKSDSETFQAILEKLNEEYEVINAGVAGFYSGQELSYIVTELVDYDPDVVIAFDGWNDLFWTWYSHIWHGQLRKKDEIGFNYNSLAFMEAQLVDNFESKVRIFDSFQRFFIAVVDRSAILSRIRWKISKFKRNFHILRSQDEQKAAAVPGEDYFEEILSVYTKNLIKMRDFCHSRGIRFFVAFQPEPTAKTNMTLKERWFVEHWPRAWNVKDYKDEFPGLYARFIEDSEEILTNNSIDFININTCPAFRDNPNTLFLDLIHPNKNGNEIIASIINEYLNSF